MGGQHTEDDCRCESSTALAAKLATLAQETDAAVATLLLEAARRLEAAGKPLFRAASVRVVRRRNPCLIEGVLDDGDEFFVRHSKGAVAVFVDDALVDYHGHWSTKTGQIDKAELAVLLRDLIDLSGASWG